MPTPARRSPVAQPVTEADGVLDGATTTTLTAAADAVIIATGKTGPGYVLVKNADPSNTMYIGASGVTATGFPLAPGESIGLKLAAVESLYGFSTDGASAAWLVLR